MPYKRSNQGKVPADCRHPEINLCLIKNTFSTESEGVKNLLPQLCQVFFFVVNSCQADGRLKVLSLLVVAGGQMKSTKWLKPDEPLLILILQWKVPLRVMAVTQRQFEWSSLWWSSTFSTIIPQRLLYKDSKKAPGWTFNLQKTRLWLPLAYTSSFLLVTQWCWPVLSDARVRYALLSISHAPSSAKSMGTTIPSGTHAAWFSSWYTSHLNLF